MLSLNLVCDQVKLRKPVFFNKLIQPVCLPTLKDVEGRIGKVVGYGRTENTSKLTSLDQQRQI